MKTNELTGAQLDYWVALADGYSYGKFGARNVFYEQLDTGAACLVEPIPSGSPQYVGAESGAESGAWLYSPSNDWAQSGPIIDREGISTTRVENWPAESQWIATHPSAPAKEYRGPTAKIAAMRAFVASEFGDEVPNACPPTTHPPRNTA